MSEQKPRYRVLRGDEGQPVIFDTLEERELDESDSDDIADALNEQGTHDGPPVDWWHAALSEAQARAEEAERQRDALRGNAGLAVAYDAAMHREQSLRDRLEAADWERDGLLRLMGEAWRGIGGTPEGAEGKSFAEAIISRYDAMKADRDGIQHREIAAHRVEYNAHSDVPSAGRGAGEDHGAQAGRHGAEMSDVPPEVHLRLFERYLTVLIDALAQSESDDNDVWLCDRIERLLGVSDTQPDIYDRVTMLETQIAKAGNAFNLVAPEDLMALEDFRDLVKTLTEYYQRQNEAAESEPDGSELEDDGSDERKLVGEAEQYRAEAHEGLDARPSSRLAPEDGEVVEADHSAGAGKKAEESSADPAGVKTGVNYSANIPVASPTPVRAENAQTPRRTEWAHRPSSWVEEAPPVVGSERVREMGERKRGYCPDCGAHTRSNEHAQKCLGLADRTGKANGEPVPITDGLNLATALFEDEAPPPTPSTGLEVTLSADGPGAPDFEGDACICPASHRATFSYWNAKRSPNHIGACHLHAHHWKMGNPVDGVTKGSCMCGASREWQPDERLFVPQKAAVEA